MDGAIFHSDHGSVYTSSGFQDTCRRLGIRQSMGRIGSSADNAMAESFNASLKRETLQGSGGWASPVQCRREVFRWITRYKIKSFFVVFFNFLVTGLKRGFVGVSRGR